MPDEVVSAWLRDRAVRFDLSAGLRAAAAPDAALAGAPRRGGLEDQLGAVGSDLLVDLRPARRATEPAVRRWARRRTTMRSYGSTIAWWPLLRRTTAPVRPATDFDGVVLVTRSTASAPVVPDGPLAPGDAAPTTRIPNTAKKPTRRNHQARTPASPPEHPNRSRT